MSLSWSEIVAIVLGLGGGYWLVSRIIERQGAPDWKSEDFGHGGPAGGPQQSSQSGARDRDKDQRHETVAAPPWWVVLGVPRIATRDEIARAYKRKISAYHPDKVAAMGEEIRAVADEKSKQINAAYDEAMRST